MRQKSFAAAINFECALNKAGGFIRFDFNMSTVAETAARANATTERERGKASRITKSKMRTSSKECKRKRKEKRKKSDRTFYEKCSHFQLKQTSVRMPRFLLPTQNEPKKKSRISLSLCIEPFSISIKCDTVAKKLNSVMAEMCDVWCSYWTSIYLANAFDAFDVHSATFFSTRFFWLSGREWVSEWVFVSAAI